MMYGKHPDGGMTETKSHDVDFLRSFQALVKCEKMSDCMSYKKMPYNLLVRVIDHILKLLKEEVAILQLVGVLL